MNGHNGHRPTMETRLPFEVREALIQAFGKAFWLKDALRSLLLSTGVPRELYDRYSSEAKFKIGRHILSELDAMGDEGWSIQRRIVTDLSNLRGLPDQSVEDKKSAKETLDYLKLLATAQKLVTDEEKSGAQQKAQDAQRRQAALAERAQKTEELRRSFYAMVQSRDDPQDRGYGLEELLADLFDIHEIPYRRPYRTSSEQIDGHFKFEDFDYLVEARWRSGPPTAPDLTAFKAKVDKKFQSTRGLFFSIIPFRPDVLAYVTQSATSNILVMDGQDLILILEGQISLTDALELKIRKAAQEGIIYFPLSQRFSTS